MTDDAAKISNGQLVTVEINGEKIQAGFNVVLDVPQLAYFANGRKLPDIGTALQVENTTYTVAEAGRSPSVQQMILVQLKEVSNA